MRLSPLLRRTKNTCKCIKKQCLQITIKTKGMPKYLTRVLILRSKHWRGGPQVPSQNTAAIARVFPHLFRVRMHSNSVFTVFQLNVHVFQLNLIFHHSAPLNLKDKRIGQKAAKSNSIKQEISLITIIIVRSHDLMNHGSWLTFRISKFAALKAPSIGRAYC